jgi:hypothetical protein
MKVFPAQALLDFSRMEEAQQPRTEYDWKWHSDGDYGGARPFNISFLYRGQNQRAHPMLPSIARGLSSYTGKVFEMPSADQAKLVLRLAQSWWFAREVDHHPIAAHAEQQRVRLDRLALAQHYGIQTGYLDLTDNFDVSAFFATCRETDIGWEPVTSNVGVIYRVNLEQAKSQLELFKPLGPQPLPRPAEQRAWVVELPLINSFDDWPAVSTIQFEEDKSIGEHFLKMFEGGKLLFPPDPLTNVAKEILQSGEIPRELVEGAIDSFAGDELGIKSDQIPALKQSISTLAHLIDYRRILQDRDVAPFLEDFEWRKKRLADVKAGLIVVRAERRDDKADGLRGQPGNDGVN